MAPEDVIGESTTVLGNTPADDNSSELAGRPFASRIDRPLLCKQTIDNKVGLNVEDSAHAHAVT